MKKAIAAAILLTGFSAGATFAQEAETEVGVVINGVRWATRNLDVGGTFVDNPENNGALYQWGRLADGHENRYSGTTTTLATSNTPGHSRFILISPSSSSSYDWLSPQNDALWNAGTEAAPIKAENDPSPTGWRVPTGTEILTLLDATKVTKAWDSAKKGYTFTDSANPSNSVFFPAAGYRENRDYEYGTVYNVGGVGCYWSSMPHIDAACNLSFSEGSAYWSAHSRSYGLSLRCVADSGSSTSLAGVSADKEVTVIGYYSITGIKLSSEPQSGFYIVVYDDGTAEKRMK